MGLLDKLKRKKEAVDWSDAYNATPRFYERPGVAPFGAVALTEGAKTVLPKDPRAAYKVRGKPVEEWKLVLVSTSKNAVVGYTDYFAALKKAEAYALDATQDALLVRALSLTELERLNG